MSERMYRAQILLDPHQRRRLEEIARREGKSISAVTRQVIDAGLESFESQSEIWKRRRRVLAEIKARRDKQPIEYKGNLIDEVRQERENEQEQIWRGDA